MIYKNKFRKVYTLIVFLISISNVNCINNSDKNLISLKEILKISYITSKKDLVNLDNKNLTEIILTNYENWHNKKIEDDIIAGYENSSISKVLTKFLQIDFNSQQQRSKQEYLNFKKNYIQDNFNDYFREYLEKSYKEEVFNRANIIIHQNYYSSSINDIYKDELLVHLNEQEYLLEYFIDDLGEKDNNDNGAIDFRIGDQDFNQDKNNKIINKLKSLTQAYNKYFSHVRTINEIIKDKINDPNYCDEFLQYFVQNNYSIEKIKEEINNSDINFLDFKIDFSNGQYGYINENIKKNIINSLTQINFKIELENIDDNKDDNEKKLWNMNFHQLYEDNGHYLVYDHNLISNDFRKCCEHFYKIILNDYGYRYCITVGAKNNNTNFLMTLLDIFLRDCLKKVLKHNTKNESIYLTKTLYQFSVRNWAKSFFPKQIKQNDIYFEYIISGIDKMLRFSPRLEMAPEYFIKDDIIENIEWIYSFWNFLKDIINKNKNICFQFDLGIIFKETVYSEDLENNEDISGTKSKIPLLKDAIGEISSRMGKNIHNYSFINTNEILESEFYEYKNLFKESKYSKEIQNIFLNIKNKLKNVNCVLNDNLLDIIIYYALDFEYFFYLNNLLKRDTKLNILRNQFTNLITEFKLNTSFNFPDNKRICSLLDRREKFKDEIYFFLPAKKKEIVYNSNGQIFPESYFQSLRESYIPKAEAAYYNLYRGYEPITSLSILNGQLIILNFQIEKGNTRCYLFRDNTFIRFFLEDLVDLFPCLFLLNAYNNKFFNGTHPLVKDIENSIGWKDKKFHWVNK